MRRHVAEHESGLPGDVGQQLPGGVRRRLGRRHGDGQRSKQLVIVSDRHRDVGPEHREIVAGHREHPPALGTVRGPARRRMQRAV